MEKKTPRHLRLLCRKLGWRTSAVTHRDLVLAMKAKWFRAKRGLRYFAEYMRKKRELEGKVRVWNDTDFCTLQPIARSRLHRVQDGPGSEYHFDIVSLVTYFLSSGSYTNPYTMKPFTESELRAAESAYLSRLPRLSAEEVAYYSVSRVEGKEERRMVKFTGSPGLLELREPIARFNREIREREEIGTDLLTAAQERHALIMAILQESVYFASDIESALRVRSTLHQNLRQMSDTLTQLYQVSPSVTRNFVEASQEHAVAHMTGLVQKGFFTIYVTTLGFILRMCEDPGEYEVET